MKKLSILFLLLLPILNSCRKNETAVVQEESGTITLNQASYKLTAGDTVVVKPQFSTTAFAKRKFVWSVTPANVASVKVGADNACTITGLTPGTANVKIEAEDKSVSASLNVSVSYLPVKTVLWVGTSIPQWCTYPLNACAGLGLKCINTSISSSGICLNFGVLNNVRDGLDLCETMEEKKARYQGKVSAVVLDAYYNSSYERAILPYLTQADAIVFDHGFNDAYQINKDITSGIDWNSTDRSTYIGAFNYLMKEILKRKPSVRIIIGGYLENQSDYQVRAGKVICQMQQTISSHYNYALLDVWNYTGIKYNFVPNTSNYIKDFNTRYGTAYTNYITDASGNITDFQVFCPDGIHPFSDLSGNADRKLDAIYTDLLKKAIN
ncbi:hypothetical protein [Mucilaginibacter sp. CSA2-8R]|uniref:hypothetical protein n=1 Tax=Mucilaginibacter sp. CSA2-8R TaxID=3141542 RepID=UPI00315C8F40